MNFKVIRLKESTHTFQKNSIHIFVRNPKLIFKSLFLLFFTKYPIKFANKQILIWAITLNHVSKFSCLCNDFVLSFVYLCNQII